MEPGDDARWVRHSIDSLSAASSAEVARLIGLVLRSPDEVTWLRETLPLRQEVYYRLGAQPWNSLDHWRRREISVTQVEAALSAARAPYPAYVDRFRTLMSSQSVALSRAYQREYEALESLRHHDTHNDTHNDPQAYRMACDRLARPPALAVDPSLPMTMTVHLTLLVAMTSLPTDLAGQAADSAYTTAAALGYRGSRDSFDAAVRVAARDTDAVGPLLLRLTDALPHLLDRRVVAGGSCSMVMGRFRLDRHGVPSVLRTSSPVGPAARREALRPLPN